MVQFRSATAVIALVHSESIRRSLASNELDRDERNNELVTNLALDAEFHRAMMAGNAAAAELSMRRRRSGRDAFAGLKKRREQKLRRDLAQAAAVDGADLSIAPLVECVPESTAVGLDSEADVGVLSFSAARAGTRPSTSICNEGYMCTPSEDSTLGGHCVSSAASSERDLEGKGIDYGYCPPGCPAAFCECYDNYESNIPQRCEDLIIDLCRDGTYVNYCIEDCDECRAYHQGICDGYICLADKGMFDFNAYPYSACDRTNIECADCYCTTYNSWCSSLGPLCAAGSTTNNTFCVETDGATMVDEICAVSECCEDNGAECAIMEETMEPTPTEEPDDGTTDPTDAAVAAAGITRYALLGAMALAAAAPTVISALL